MKSKKSIIGIVGFILGALFLVWQWYVAGDTIKIGGLRWENLGNNLSCIRYGHKILIGPGGIELEERAGHIFGMCMKEFDEEWFIIDMKTYQVFIGKRYDELFRKIKGRYPLTAPKHYETFETRKQKRGL